MPKPLVSIVIVNWNGLEDTKLCLAQTRKQTYLDFEVIVVDNGSTDGSVSYLRTVEDVILVENAVNRGFTGGHIAGYKASRGEYILLLNNDAVMEEHYIERAVNIMQANDTIGALGGRAYLWDDNNPLFEVTNDFYAYQNINPITAEGIFTKIDEGVLQEVNNVSGSCVMVRRSTIENVGYLHDRFFAYYEESDLFARMKRAGYKIMYSPNLTIWHANGKSAQRKAPTFSYYMMMRNRFAFAVRNFDSLSLKRFLKFYLRMGIASAIRSILVKKERPMHSAYVRAFFYNLMFGWRAFIERKRLSKLLPGVSYNEIISLEQTGISVVVDCDSRQTIDQCVALARSVYPLSEVVMVVTKPEMIRYAKGFASILDRGVLRLCINTQLFKTHAFNVGVICAKNEWVLILQGNARNNEPFVTSLHRALYHLQSNNKALGLLTKNNTPFDTLTEALTRPCASDIIIRKSLFIEAGGLLQELKLTDAIRALVTYAALDHTLYALDMADFEERPSLPPYNSRTMSDDQLLERLSLLHADAQVDKQQKHGLFSKLTRRFYRLAQLTYLLQWLFSPKIKLRLKLARTRNIVFALFQAKRQTVALELKHIRNELIKSRRPVLDVEQRKQYETRLLTRLKEHPEETPIFIITRDRLEPLSKLLAWLKAQHLERIILVDNDSALPTLTDYLLNTPYQVLEMGRNAGHKVMWESGIIKVLLPDWYYVVSDPDVIPALNSPTVLPYLYEIHERYPDYIKVGLGLKIDDLPDSYTLKQEVVQWESQFWKTTMEANIFEAGVDTTFALYKPFTYYYTLHPSLRTGEPYVARHLPWHADSNKLSDEEIFYQLRADQNVNSWNKDRLPERYIKELTKERH